MALEPLRGGHPLPSQLSDTPHASSREQTADDGDSHPSPTANDDSQPTPRSTRSQSLATLSSVASQPIKRKPLSSTASPLVARYSQRDHQLEILAGLPKPDTRFSRSYSIDSPTLYEFSNANRQSGAGTLSGYFHGPPRRFTTLYAEKLIASKPATVPTLPMEDNIAFCVSAFDFAVL